MRIRSLLGAALRPDAHFGTAVAPQHRPVLHQRHFQPQARRRHRRAGAGDTTADHHEVIMPAVFGLLGQAQSGASKLGQRPQFIRRFELRVGAKQNGVTTAFETRQIMQGD